MISAKTASPNTVASKERIPRISFYVLALRRANCPLAFSLTSDSLTPHSLTHSLTHSLPAGIFSTSPVLSQY